MAETGLFSDTAGWIQVGSSFSDGLFPFVFFSFAFCSGMNSTGSFSTGTMPPPPANGNPLQAGQGPLNTTADTSSKQMSPSLTLTFLSVLSFLLVSLGTSRLSCPFRSTTVFASALFYLHYFSVVFSFSCPLMLFSHTCPLMLFRVCFPIHPSVPSSPRPILSSPSVV